MSRGLRIQALGIAIAIAIDTVPISPVGQRSRLPSASGRTGQLSSQTAQSRGWAKRLPYSPKSVRRDAASTSLRVGKWRAMWVAAWRISIRTRRSPFNWTRIPPAQSTARVRSSGVVIFFLACAHLRSLFANRTIDAPERRANRAPLLRTGPDEHACGRLSRVSFFRCADGSLKQSLGQRSGPLASRWQSPFQRSRWFPDTTSRRPKRPGLLLVTEPAERKPARCGGAWYPAGRTSFLWVSRPSTPAPSRHRPSPRSGICSSVDISWCRRTAAASGWERDGPNSLGTSRRRTIR